MKKTVRILIPILLALTIILCCAWYLLVYDREFSRDILLYGARVFEAQGNHTVATWFYDRAYDQAGDNDSIAVELAEQYRKSGNYTKAEYTLSKAIQDGGGSSLYMALCQTYVEQDKLLDAVSLLDNVTGAVKEELDALRPQAPQATPAPGFYSQYLPVTVATESGTLYVNANGEYPSVETDLYSEPLQLVLGENALYAICVAENGLVSPLSIFGYTVGGVIEEVSFADTAMESAIRELLGVSEGVTLYTNDLWNITEFEIPADAKDYSDLKHLIYLNSLTIRDGVSGQLGSLSALTNLTTLDITNTSVSSDELKVIGTLYKLETLILNNCSLSSTADLAGCTAVNYLDLSNNTIRDISGLKAMTALQEVYLQRNVVTDLSALSGCAELMKLDISYNSVTSLSPVCGLSKLNWIHAGNNSIAEVNNIGKLTALEYLYLDHNMLTNVAPISAIAGLCELDVSNNSLTDIASLSAMNKLMYLDFSFNQVTTIPKWSKDCMLVTIDGSNNLITSIDPLSGLGALNDVLMDYNAELSSVEALQDCPVLIKVNIYGTKVTEVDMLTKQSIIVNYDPTQE